jgi:hypothetical protein
MENDYRAIRAFAGRSSLHTYLLSVIAHYYQDWRNARLGKWRPSTEARRLGPVAVRLETLIGRDGLTLDQACELLRMSGTPLSQPAADALVSPTTLSLSVPPKTDPPMQRLPRVPRETRPSELRPPCARRWPD